MNTVLSVEGMSCSHCENAVKKAVSAINGVTAVEVSLKDKTVSVTHDGGVSTGTITREIEEAGYDVG